MQLDAERLPILNSQGFVTLIFTYKPNFEVGLVQFLTHLFFYSFVMLLKGNPDD